MMSALMASVIATAYAGWEGYAKTHGPSLVKQVLCILFVKFFLPIIPTFRFRSRRYFISY